MQQAVLLLLRQRAFPRNSYKSAFDTLRLNCSIASVAGRVQCRPFSLNRRLSASQPKKPKQAAGSDSSSRPPPPKLFAASKRQQPASNSKATPQKQTSTIQAKASPGNTSFTGTKGPVPHVPTSNKSVYPASLLVYHAGMPMIFFISTTKFAAILVFIFSVCFIAPQYYLDPLEPNYMAAIAAGGGALVMGINVLAVPSVITFVHIALPAWARMSTPRLHQYLKNLPPHASLDITAIRWIWPRVSHMAVSELAVGRGTLYSFRLRRNVPAEVYEARKWYHWRPIKNFLVASRSSKVKDNAAWAEIIDTVRRGWARDPRMSKVLESST